MGSMAAGTHQRGRSRPPAVTRPQEAELREALRAVIDPELGDNVVDLGMVPSISISADGKKMTEVFDNKQTGRISTYIDEKQ